MRPPPRHPVLLALVAGLLVAALEVGLLLAVGLWLGAVQDDWLSGWDLLFAGLVGAIAAPTALAASLLGRRPGTAPAAGPGALTADLGRAAVVGLVAAIGLVLAHAQAGYAAALAGGASLPDALAATGRGALRLAPAWGDSRPVALRAPPRHAPPVNARQPPARVLAGRFQLLAPLGQGAMGAVWRARDLQVGRDVAIKVVLDAGGSHQRGERLRREAELAARLDHPGVVKVHAAGADDAGRPWVALELVEGARTLDAVWTALDLRQRVGLVREAALALAHAHARGVVHRDVKPQNILVDALGRVRVTDFGLAAAADLERLTRTGASVGTPQYMAPEQLGGAQPGPPADVWALGVLLYEALVGRPPFEADDLPALVGLIARADPDPPRRVDPRVPRALEAVALRALAREPGARFPDAGAFAAALDAALAARGGAGGRPGVALAALAAGAVAVVAVVAAAAVARRGPGGPPRDAGPAAATTATTPAPPPATTATAPPEPHRPLALRFAPGERLRWRLVWGSAGALQRIEYRARLACEVVTVDDDRARLDARMEALAVETTSLRYDSETSHPDDFPLFRRLLPSLQRDLRLEVVPSTGAVPAVRSAAPLDRRVVAEARAAAPDLASVIDLMAGELGDEGLRRALESCLRLPAPPGRLGPAPATWTTPDHPAWKGGGDEGLRGAVLCRLDRARGALEAELVGPAVEPRSGRALPGARWHLEAVLQDERVARAAVSVRLDLPGEEEVFAATDAWFSLEALPP